MANLIKARSGTASKGSSASRFQYKPRSAEEIRQRASRQIGSRDSFFDQKVEFFTPKPGDNVVRIFPPTWEGAGHYGIDLFVHYSIGADESAYLCRDKMKGEKCPLCEERVRASAAGEEELADELKPRMRVAVWVIDRSQEGRGPLVWNMPAGLDKDICNLAQDKQTKETYFIDNPEEGYDVSFTREGKDQRTKYTGIQIARRASPLSDDPDTTEKWMEFVAARALPGLLVYREYDEIKAAFAGQAPNKPEGDAPAAKGGDGKEAKTAKRGEPKPEDKPSWGEVHGLGEAELSAMIDDLKLTVPDDGFTSLEGLQDWMCEQLEVEKPTSASATKPNWKDRLKSMQAKK